MNISPGEALDRLEHGDPQMVFAMSAVQEQHERTTDRWDHLYDAIAQLAEVWTK